MVTVKQTLPAFLLVASVVGAGACGSYSKEDLLFAAAVPRPLDIALTPPGVNDDDVQPQGASGTAQNTQALAACESDDTLRCQAQAIALGLNALSVGFLEIIDGIQQFAPSERAEGRRVWGPTFIGDGNAVTFRFEMTRLDTNVYAHCLHIGLGDLSRADMSEVRCDVETHDSGMVRLLSGEFVAGTEAEERARSGAGRLFYDANLHQQLDENLGIEGTFDIQYDHFSGTTIAIVLDNVETAEGIFPPTANYAFTENDEGAGAFYFALRDNVEGNAFSSPELFQVASRWTSADAGRAQAVVSGGDLGDLVWDVNECWDEALETVYFRSPEPDQPDVGDDESVCAFGAFE